MVSAGAYLIWQVRTSGLSCCWIWAESLLCHCCHMPSDSGAAPLGTPQLSAHAPAAPAKATDKNSNPFMPIACAQEHVDACFCTKETNLFRDTTGVPQAKASESVMGSNVVGAHEQDGEILISLSVVNAQIPTKAPS